MQEELVATPRTAVVRVTGVALPCPPIPSTHVPARRSNGVSGRSLAPVSASAAVLVNELARQVDPLEGSRAERNHVGHRGNLETDARVGAGTVVVGGAGRQHPLERARFQKDPVKDSVRTQRTQRSGGSSSLVFLKQVLARTVQCVLAQGGCHGRSAGSYAAQ